MKPEIKEAIDRYAREGSPVGDFLTAVLSNDLRDAVCRADAENLRDIKEIVLYVHWEIPSACWGSKKRVVDWLERHCFNYV